MLGWMTKQQPVNKKIITIGWMLFEYYWSGGLKMPESPKHTPTPWEVTEPMEDYHEFDTPFGYRRENGDWSTVGWARCASRESTQANAEFIVRSVNAHDDLLAACRAFVNWYNVDSTEFNSDTVYEMARAAIAKAEAQP